MNKDRIYLHANTRAHACADLALYFIINVAACWIAIAGPIRHFTSSLSIIPRFINADSRRKKLECLEQP